MGSTKDREDRCFQYLDVEPTSTRVCTVYNARLTVYTVQSSQNSVLWTLFEPTAIDANGLSSCLLVAGESTQIHSLSLTMIHSVSGALFTHNTGEEMALILFSLSHQPWLWPWMHLTASLLAPRGHFLDNTRHDFHRPFESLMSVWWRGHRRRWSGDALFITVAVCKPPQFVTH